MAIMEDIWYLPEERLNYRNYPEVDKVIGDIDKLMLYSMEVSEALIAYNDNSVDKIDVDIVKLQSNIQLCRKVSEVLGKAPKVCFDLLVELREVQSVMQTLMYAYRRFGSQYIGKPTENTSEANSNVIG